MTTAYKARKKAIKRKKWDFTKLLERYERQGRELWVDGEMILCSRPSN